MKKRFPPPQKNYNKEKHSKAQLNKLKSSFFKCFLPLCFTLFLQFIPGFYPT